MTSHMLVQGFPDYFISDDGDVTNIETGRKLKHNYNWAGIAVVYLYKDEVKYCRSVAVLVAKHFVLNPLRRADTVIHLDGDRRNVRAENLAWRSRPFAIMYHHQFERPYPNRINAPLRIVETQEIFDSSFDLAKAYGLLESGVVLAAMNGSGNHSHTTYPHAFHIEYA